MSDHRQEILPILYPALHRNVETHWNTTVMQLTQHILQQFKEMDADLFSQVQSEFQLKLVLLSLFLSLYISLSLSLWFCSVSDHIIMCCMNVANGQN